MNPSSPISNSHLLEPFFIIQINPRPPWGEGRNHPPAAKVGTSFRYLPTTPKFRGTLNPKLEHRRNRHESSTQEHGFFKANVYWQTAPTTMDTVERRPVGLNKKPNFKRKKKMKKSDSTPIKPLRVLVSMSHCKDAAKKASGREPMKRGRVGFRG